MADINYNGGKVVIAAATLPNMRTITINSKPSWVSGDSSVHGNGNVTWIGTVGANNNQDDRSGTINATVTTDSDSSYQGTASMTCGWTVTQAGTGATPTKQISISWQSGYLSNSSGNYVSVNSSTTAVTHTPGDEGTSFNGSAWADQQSATLDVGAETTYTINLVQNTSNYFTLNENLLPGVTNYWTFGVDVRRGSPTGTQLQQLGWVSTNIGAAVVCNWYDYLSNGETLYLLPTLMIYNF